MDVVDTEVYPFDLSGFNVPLDKRFWIFTSGDEKETAWEEYEYYARHIFLSHVDALTMIQCTT